MTKFSGLTTRMSPDRIELFEQRARLHRKTKSAMLRELADAFIEGRVTITLRDVDSKIHEDMYQ